MYFAIDPRLIGEIQERRVGIFHTVDMSSTGVVYLDTLEDFGGFILDSVFERAGVQ